MAVRIRLTRVGSKKNPIYRVVVADSRSPRDGRFIEIIGRYNPQTDPSTIELDEAKVKEWLRKGAPSRRRPRRGAGGGGRARGRDRAAAVRRGGRSREGHRPRRSHSARAAHDRPRERGPGAAAAGDATSELVTVGRVGRPHGVDGAFFVEDASEADERFSRGATLHVD